MENKKTFSVISYNVAGLPITIDLNDLPWFLKPIAWIYKLIKKTTVIPLNTDGPGVKGTELQDEKLLAGNYDIIGVQEDFNYHTNLVEKLSPSYIIGKFTGGLELNKFCELVHFYINRLPTFRIDGLELFTKSERVKVLGEWFCTWNQYCGYFDHGNDGLMDKGFRRYQLIIDETLPIDVYVLHMDASWGNDSDEQTCDSLARQSQFKQLAEYINNTGAHNPIIIMGDFNTSDKYLSDRQNIEMFYNALDFNYNIDDAFKRVGKYKANEDLDKILYINDVLSMYKITPIECDYVYTFYDDEGERLSDHFPIAATFEYEKTTN